LAAGLIDAPYTDNTPFRITPTYELTRISDLPQCEFAQITNAQYDSDTATTLYQTNIDGSLLENAWYNAVISKLPWLSGNASANDGVEISYGTAGGKTQISISYDVPPSISPQLYQISFNTIFLVPDPNGPYAGYPNIIINQSTGSF
jgi:hypothetical protein